MLFDFAILLNNYLWTYFEWLLSFPEGLIETDRAKCIFGHNRFNSCFPNEVIMLIMLKRSMMKRKTSQFQACLPLIDTTLCNSPDNIINDYKWNEYFVTAKCSAYKSHKRGFKQDAETHRQCRYETNDSGRMIRCDWGFLNYWFLRGLKPLEFRAHLIFFSILFDLNNS